AWLKYYYPVEFMAALMTSVIDNSTKAAEYLYHCKELGIPVLPPDINKGWGPFTTEGNSVRYGLYAIKSLGRPVIDRLIEERKIGGPYRTLQDFIERNAQREINKRAIENLIKAGACDSLDGTRKQMTMTHASMLDQVSSKKKSSVAGQMSLFDLVSEEDRSDYEIQYPDVGEFQKEMLLGFEKEVLGIYLSGHPLEEYMDKMKKNVTAMTSDFVRDEETGELRIKDNDHVVVGGLIAEKTVKFTRNNKAMAFISIEDLTGTVEVIIFPKDYERYQTYLNTDEKIFVIGRATVEEEQNGKIICERIVSFDETEKELWLQFATKEIYQEKEAVVMDLLYDSDGGDAVVFYIANPKAIKRLGANQTVAATPQLLENLTRFLGEGNVKIVEKSIEGKR
ncbi:MAG: DNA polymerase III subunit alpha, partial [Agathobacter sp.]|nr:DNA polymerase III subunit alpha [Agathobacter sp.]